MRLDFRKKILLCISGEDTEQKLQRYQVENFFGCLISTRLVSKELTFIIRVITKLPNSEQSNKGKVKTHKYLNRQNQSTTGKL